MDRSGPGGYVGAVHMVTATLKVYRDAAVDASRAFARSAWALLALALCFPLLVVVGTAVSPLGIVGGLIVGLLTAAAAGTYLATLQDALAARRSMGPQVLRANLARYTWDIVGVLFPLWVLDLALSFARAPYALVFAVGVGVALAFNPVPEMIGRARSGGMDLLGEAGRFMLNSGVEWLLPQLVLLGLVWVVVPGHALELLGLFGPRFGFVAAGSLAFVGAGGGAVAWAVGIVLVAVVHLAMLFRGALYERLSSGGRRARAWQERFR